MATPTKADPINTISTGPAEIISKPFQPPPGAVGWEGFLLTPEQSLENAETVTSTPIPMPSEGSLIGFNNASKTESVEGQVVTEGSSFINNVTASAVETGFNTVANIAQGTQGAVGEGSKFLWDVITASNMESYTNKSPQPQTPSVPDTSSEPPPDRDKLFQIRHFIDSLSKKPETKQEVVQVGDQLVGREQFLEVVGISTSFQDINTTAGETRVDLQISYEQNAQSPEDIKKAQREASLGQAIGKTGVATIDGKMVFEGGSILSAQTSTG